MIKIGCKHNLDIDSFKKWHTAKEMNSRNGICDIETLAKEYYLKKIDRKDSNKDFGEGLYTFVDSLENESSVRRAYLWDGSLPFFIPIQKLVQEELEI